MAQGNGSLSMVCSGTGPLGFGSDNLSGSYSRVGLVMTMSMSGTCGVNGIGVNCHMHIVGLLAAVPSGGAIHNVLFAGFFSRHTLV